MRTPSNRFYFLQAWEQDKQKIHNHLDGIKGILDARVLALNAAAQQASAPQVPPPEERPVLAALPVAAPSDASPKAQPAEKEPDAKSDLSGVSASSGAGKETAEKLKRKAKELCAGSSEMDVACILNDLANAPAEGESWAHPKQCLVSFAKNLDIKSSKEES